MEPSQREVGIIGAGMTGLCACKHLMQHGFKPTVLEARGFVGGIWRSTCSITKLQTSRDGYQFSDFLWPEGTPLNPHNEQVVEYLESYANHFLVKDRILFNCKVVEIKSNELDADRVQSDLWGSNGTAFANVSDKKVWQVLVQRRKSPLEDEVHEEWLQFDFLVICGGRFGDCPKYPEFPPDGGPQCFSGPQGHPCHLIFRSPNWVFLNRKSFGKLVSLFYFTRFSELMNIKPGQGWLLNVLSTCLSPLKWACSKVIELYLLHHLPLWKYGLVPKHSFSKHAYSCKSYVLPDEFFPSVEKSEIIPHKTSHWSFCKDGVVLHDGTFIPADVVILGTGYDSHKKLFSMFPNKYLSSLLDPLGMVPLYRGSIHPRIPHLAILGYQLKFSHLHSSEMSARWLAYFLRGRMCIPNVLDMEKDAQEWINHMCSVSPFCHQACLGSAGIWHSDQMCRDMGWNPWRKKSLYQEFFNPYSNMDYKDN